jgi:hypothetical protein
MEGVSPIRRLLGIGVGDVCSRPNCRLLRKPSEHAPTKTQAKSIIKKAMTTVLSSSTMPPTSPQVAQEIFDALLFTPFHENVTVYPDDVFVASPRRNNFQPPMTAITPAATYVSVLDAGRPLEDMPVSTTTQGSFPLPDHATAAIAAILSYYLPHDIDARLHNHQWFLIGQGRHPRRTIFIPSTRRRNVHPTEPRPADFVTVYMNDEDFPLPTPPQSETTTESTHEAESSLDLTRG